MNSKPLATALAAVALAGGATVATPSTAHALAPTPSVCGSGSWTVARKATTGAVQSVKVNPGSLVLYRRAVGNKTQFCAVFFNTSGRAQKMTVRMIYAPAVGSRLTGSVRPDSGTFSSYAGPLKVTVSHDIRVRAFAYGPGGAWDFVEADG